MSLLSGLVPTVPAGGGQTHPLPPTLQAHAPRPTESQTRGLVGDRLLRSQL